MSSSTIRKAIGAVKDQTSIGLAKVSSNIAPDLEVAILKATSHDDEPADEKHIREILNLSSYSQGYASACVATVSRRLSKTRDWIVALKTLMLIHRLLNEDVPALHHELLHATRRGTRLLNMSDFRDEAHSSSWDHSAFVRTYAFFLDQRLEYMIPNNKQAGYGCGEEGEGSFYSPPERQSSHPSYLYYDYSGENHGKNSNLNFSQPLREMTPEKALDRMNQLQKLFDRFLACRPIGLAKSNRMIITALYPIVRESFQLYADICEALAVLLDLFFDIEYAFCVKSFDAYANAAKQIDELNAFYGWCKDAGVARSSEYPAVQRITDKLLETLHEFMGNRAASPNSSPRCVEPASVKPLPSPSDDEEPNPEPKFHIQVQPQGELVDLREEVEADWELALVEAAGELAKKKTAQGGGFDHLPGPEKTDTAILSLPAADGTVQNIGGDPFAASLSIPPPSYVQMDDIAKKQQLLMQEQLLWHQYSRGGIPGQASLAKLNNAHYYPNQTA